MISPDDVRFHTPDDPPFDWAETNFFSAWVPEANLHAWIYTLARPGVGALVCDIGAIDLISQDKLDAVYVDVQQHLPLPDRLEKYSLPNGLSLQTSNEPRDYHLHYEGVDDTVFHWDVHGLMEPYDINDPSMDPMASPDVSTTGFGSAYASHFDMSVHVTGSLRVRGREFPVDCTTVMDHSWGPRSERLMTPMGWINACFGDDYSISNIWSRNVHASGYEAYTFRHGYALVDGEVRGLVSGQMRASRTNTFFPVSYEMRVVDITGYEHVLTGAPLVQYPWTPNSNLVVPHSGVEWHTRDGRTGFGLTQESVALDRFSGAHFTSTTGNQA